MSQSQQAVEGATTPGSSSSRRRRRRGRPGQGIVEANRKTEICRHWQNGRCPYGAGSCAFAHGLGELRHPTLDEETIAAGYMTEDSSYTSQDESPCELRSERRLPAFVMLSQGNTPVAARSRREQMDASSFFRTTQLDECSVPPSPPANVTRGRSSSGYNTPNFHHRGAPSLSTPPTHTEFAPAYGGFSNGSSGLYPPASPMVRGSDSVDSAFRMPWSPAASPATRSPIGRSPATVLRQQSSSGRNGGGGGFTDSGGSPTVGFGGRHRRAPSAGDISR